MALSYLGWIDGITGSGVVIAGLLLGLILIYQSKRTNAKLLKYLGIIIISIGGNHLGVFIDFLTVMFTGKNVNNPYGFVGLISFIWAPIQQLCGVFIVAEILDLKNKKLIFSIFLATNILFLIIILIDPLGSINFRYPEVSGEALIDYNINFQSFAGILLAINMFMVFIFIIIGLLIKWSKSTKIIRKKLMLFNIGVILYAITVTFGIYSEPGIFIIFIRAGLFLSFLIWYIAIRETQIKTERPKKEIKVDSGFFRLSELKPGEITEEDVSLYRDRAVCLVCRSQIIGFSYICQCKALYCEKCARSLSNLENACWVCNAPFDESKPVKPFKEEEEIEVEATEKPLKRPKSKF